MKQYKELVERILAEGVSKGDRTGTGTKSVFGHQMRFDLQEGLPVVAGKKTFLRGVIHELLWMLSGSTNVKDLQAHDVHIWDEWAQENGDLGPVYGAQWRAWRHIPEDQAFNLVEEAEEIIDQITEVIETLKKSPDSRRMIVSAWNVGELPDMALSPCHCLFQFWTKELTHDERVKLAKSSTYYTVEELNACGIPSRVLSCQLYQRSADVFLGVPFNIASYAILTHLIANIVGMTVGEFIWTGGDCHLYDNHHEQVQKYLEQYATYDIASIKKPKITVNPFIQSIDEYTYKDIEISGYESAPPIKAPVAV